MGAATRNPPGLHSHTIELTGDEIQDLKDGKTLSVLTSHDNAHDHQLEISMTKAKNRESQMKYCSRETDDDTSAICSNIVTD